jgi:hypothetical protein
MVRIDTPVPCNGCTLCCRGDAVRLLPNEIERFQNEPHALFSGLRMLAHQSNGNCVYLGPNGCAIHDDKPYMCRTMDCRLLAKRLTYTQARKMTKQGRVNMEVWKRGKELLRD